MFNKLRNKIIIITMTITTVVLILAGCSVMFFSSTMRPEPKPFQNAFGPEPEANMREYIKTDRDEGSTRLLVTLFSVGAIVELLVFLISYYLSKRIVAPVKESYDNQKLFIANASHELKTPLAVIEANVEALEVNKENKKWKDNIENEITHANKLVLNLLQLAKMDAGNVEKVATEEVDMDSEIKERVEIFKPKFKGKINFKSNAKSKKYMLPKQDALQVLDILMDNATKYGKNKIVVSLESNGFSILNDGATVDKKDSEKIFERFYQTDKTKEGSGLGLSIASAICRQNNWKIVCESDKNTTKFSVKLGAR
mgnify:CR=1 FL=1